MKNKDFREIQVSSTLLVVIFLGVLALGVFIFLLGVSVGKKQSAVSSPTQVVTQQIPEPVKPAPADTETGAAASEPGPGALRPAPDVAAQKTLAKEPVVDKTPVKRTVETKSAAPAARGLYYVQVLAVADRAQAQAAADKYRKQGYTAVIADPPAGEKNFKVRLGGFATRDRAADLLKKLNTAAGKITDYWIVQY